jgi:hypothetical protein
VDARSPIAYALHYFAGGFQFRRSVISKLEYPLAIEKFFFGPTQPFSFLRGSQQAEGNPFFDDVTLQARRRWRGS